MRPQAFTRSAPARTAGLLLLLALLLAGLPAYGQAIKVTSAVPDATDQGTVGLVVTIGGENFSSGARVAFYVTGTTNPGGVAVKGVKFKDSTTLEATIDVAPDAQTDLKFDVQVKCGGRTGKGTELFSVRVKTEHSIPPGSVTDLQVSDIGYRASFTFTLPADDGYDVASGPPAEFHVRVRKDWTPETPDCGPYTVESWTDRDVDDPCHVSHAGGWDNLQPGATVTRTASLAPDTPYWVIVRTKDDDTPVINWSALETDVAFQVHFTTGSAPSTPWATDVVDLCPPLSYDTCQMGYYPRFAFDREGNPAILYEKGPPSTDHTRMLASLTPGGWQLEELPPETRGGEVDFAFDPSGYATVARAAPAARKWDLKLFRRTGGTSEAWESETVVASGVASGNGTVWHALAFNPVDGSPAVVYPIPKANSFVLRLAERRGSSWTIEDVVASVGYTPDAKLAFDSEGNPAVVHSLRPSGGPSRTAIEYRKDGRWSSEVVDVPQGFGTSGRPGIVYDARRGNFSVADVVRQDLEGNCGSTPGCYGFVRYCERSGGTWSCQTIDEGPSAWLGGLAADEGGATYVAYKLDATLFVSFRSPDGTWNREYVEWRAGPTYRDVRVGPQGQVGIVYDTSQAPTGAGWRDSVLFVLRPAPVQ